MTADLPEDLAAVIRRLQTAYEEARALTTGIDEPRAGFDATTQLSAVLQKMLNEVAELRALIVASIHENEPQPLSKLADRFGISKSRADQMVQHAKAARRKERGEQT